MSRRFELAVLGSPVTHSKSPLMHNAGLKALGLSGRYLAIEVDTAGMSEMADRVRSGALDGANITMPHKGTAARLSDVLTESASRSGSVNTWLVAADRLVGDSTDVAGVRDVMGRRGMEADEVLILGNGGAASAAVIACESRNVWVSGRSSERTQGLIDRLDVNARACEWGRGVPGATVINATPIGMHGESLDSQVLEQAAAIFDMTYGAVASPAVKFALANGLACADGIDLLAAQAERSFELWTGTRPPVGLFERVARNVSSPSDEPPI